MIVFELSGSYEFAVAAMICVVMSTLVSYLLFGHSYFSRQLKDRNIDITMGRGYLRMSELPVQDYMRRDEYLALKPDCTRADAVAKMAAAAASPPTPHPFGVHVESTDFRHVQLLRSFASFLRCQHTLRITPY